MGTDDFYEAQSRLDGAFCQITEDQKFEFLKEAYNKVISPRSEFYLTLLMDQWVEMEAVENVNHASLLCFFDSLGAVRRISSLESASSRVITHRHAFSA